MWPGGVRAARFSKKENDYNYYENTMRIKKDCKNYVNTMRITKKCMIRCFKGLLKTSESMRSFISK